MNIRTPAPIPGAAFSRQQLMARVEGTGCCQDIDRYAGETVGDLSRSADAAIATAQGRERHTMQFAMLGSAALLAGCTGAVLGALGVVPFLSAVTVPQAAAVIMGTCVADFIMIGSCIRSLDKAKQAAAEAQGFRSDLAYYGELMTREAQKSKSA